MLAPQTDQKELICVLKQDYQQKEHDIPASGLCCCCTKFDQYLFTHHSLTDLHFKTQNNQSKEPIKEDTTLQ